MSCVRVLRTHDLDERRVRMKLPFEHLDSRLGLNTEHLLGIQPAAPMMSAIGVNSSIRPAASENKSAGARRQVVCVGVRGGTGEGLERNIGAAEWVEAGSG